MTLEDIHLGKLKNLLHALSDFSYHKRLHYKTLGPLEVNSSPAGEQFFDPIVIPIRLRESAVLLLDQIDRQIVELEDFVLGEGREVVGGSEGRKLSLGVVYLECVESPILRGSFRLVERRTIGPHISNVLALFIAKVGRKDIVARENHGWGYHFHYCRGEDERSDTIFTFQRAPDKAGREIVEYEKHAERNCDFCARVESWGVEKKISAYNACLKGLGKFALTDFRHPGASAKTLWPVS